MKRPRLLISGYYGLGNAGDEAVLAGLLQGLREVGLDSEITVLSARPALTEKWHGVRAVSRMKPAAVAAIAECDVLVSGGGSLLQDRTSFASLAYYLGVIAMASAAGKRLAIAAQGMGPLIRPASRQCVGAVLRRADLITVRDEESAALLRDCGIPNPIHVTADPAYLLQPPRPPSDGAGAIRRAGPPRIGLALRAWPDRDPVAWGADLCRSLADRGAVPLLIPMQEFQDRALAEAVRAASGAGVEISPPPDRLGDVLSAIRRCDALVGMRLHALILAAVAGIPPLAWSYDPKVDSQMRRLGGMGVRLPLRATPAAAAEAVLSAIGRDRDPGGMNDLRAQALKTLELLSERVILPG